MPKGLLIGGASAALKRLREDAGFASVPAAATKLNVHRSLISKYEAGLVDVPESYLKKLAKALGRSLTYVVLECLKDRYEALNQPELAPLLIQVVQGVEGHV
jgi:transcriptional regulator with XRE-family HTH domain